MEILKYFLEKNPQANLRNKDNKNPLNLAKSPKIREILQNYLNETKYKYHQVQIHKSKEILAKNLIGEFNDCTSNQFPINSKVSPKIDSSISTNPISEIMLSKTASNQTLNSNTSMKNNTTYFSNYLNSTVKTTSNSSTKSNKMINQTCDLERKTSTPIMSQLDKSKYT